jgi:hypothetical protein
LWACAFHARVVELHCGFEEERAAHGDIRALVLEGTDGKARAEVESSADEFEIAPSCCARSPTQVESPTPKGRREVTPFVQIHLAIEGAIVTL